MKILAIETSCDETSLSMLEASGGIKSPKIKIIKNLIASQIETHRPWGGVVPNLAKREHISNLPILFKKLVPKAYVLKPNLLAVTIGPGLEPCLWTGINFAKEIQKKYFQKAKIIGTNHLHGHMYSFLLPQDTIRQLTDKIHAIHAIQNTRHMFPAVQLLVSGGHTILIYMKSITEYKKIGETRDDAAGEAFDKVARMLNLQYPGGPEIEKISKHGNPNAITFPRPMINQKNYDFSFSGLKTSVLYYLRSQQNEINPQQKEVRDHKIQSASWRTKYEIQDTRYKIQDIAASFQEAAIDVLVTKTIRAAKELNAKSIILSGGVAANSALRKKLRQMSMVNGQVFISADKKYHGDNAAMIGTAGYITFLKNKKYPRKADGGLNL